MSLQHHRNRIIEPVLRLSDALSNPKQQGRAAAIVIALYVVLWTLVAVSFDHGWDIHHDMAEIFAWSREPAFGYLKHPPFAAWVAMAWFLIFPRADWAYYLLSMVCSGCGLWFVWSIAGQVVAGHRRAAALMLLSFSHAFSFFASKFNPNLLLAPVWAAATFLFLRSWRDRTAISGALAGLGATIAMLTKYWSVFLILGFVVAALSSSERRAYFRSPAPYVSVAVGLLLIIPNIASLVYLDFEPFKYAVTTHAAPDLRQLLLGFGSYFSGLFYLTGVVVVFVLFCRPARTAWRDSFWPRESSRRFMAIIQWASLCAPVPVAFAIGAKLSPLWVLPMWSMLPALLLSCQQITVTRRTVVSILAAACAVPCITLAAAPLISPLFMSGRVNEMRNYFSPLAHEVDRLWPEVSAQPLRFVAGNDDLAAACAFYCSDSPRVAFKFTRSGAPWLDVAGMARDGFAALCLDGDAQCITTARNIASGNAGVREETIEISSRKDGNAAVPRRFTVVLVPPRR